jgi:hypothetical protein
MSWLKVPGQPAQSPPGRRRTMGAGIGISLIVLGAILVFAVSGSPHWLNLRVVGIVLIVAGALGMALPGRLRRRARTYPDHLSRWVLPGQFPVASDSVTDQGDGLGVDALVRQLTAEDPPTVADDLLEQEHDPPV